MSKIDIVRHRVNSVKDLESLPIEFGAEIDVRYHNDELILHHDPFSHHSHDYCNLSDFLEAWKHQGILILNIKTEGIEKKCIQLMAKYQIKRWFFLDLSMPFFVKYCDLALDDTMSEFGVENLAVRYSDREPIEYSLSFSGKVGWVWVDCFKYLKLDQAINDIFRSSGFRLCLVSPELQGHSPDLIDVFKASVRDFQIDAVCTKFPERWNVNYV
jgi:hypothetical protein